MPGLLRPRISCFYCGSRTAHVKDGKTRQFTCQVCEATNHLDHNGEITDPPATHTKAQAQTYAHTRPKSASPRTANLAQSDDLFCKACLKNQHFLTNCLAEYLPSEDHPDYEKYERQYPQYRKDLERRYPQVCHQCAPKAQERIRKTGYAAKVDFLTRSLERSKASPVAPPATTTTWLLRLALSISTVAWWTSLSLQVLWHAVSLAAVPAYPDQNANMTPLMIVGCSITAVRNGYLVSGCSHLFVQLVRQALHTALYLAWWNPALKTKLRSSSRQHQWVGLADFYRFQLLVYLARVLAWWKLSEPPVYPSQFTIHRASHGLALLFILMGALASQRIVSYVYAPIVPFKDTTGSLVDPDSFQYPSDTSATQSVNRSPVSLLPRTSPTSFNIASLGPRRDVVQIGRYAPPTPPPDSVAIEPADQLDTADSMDWEPLPSHHASQFATRTQNTSFLHNQPAAPAIPAFLRPPASVVTGETSPFFGRLPSAPISPAQRLRNPPPRPQFKPTPLSQQQDFFHKMRLNPAALPESSKRSSATYHSSDDEKEIDESSNSNPSHVHTSTGKDYFRPAQWTLKSDLDAAARGTGLEDMFSTSFQIGGNTPTQTPRKGRSEARHPETATHPAAADDVGGSLQAYAWPVLLAILAAMVAVVRDPYARQWLVDTYESMVSRPGLQRT